MSEPHHTAEQIFLGFSHAPVVLKLLVDAGVRLPRFELFADASGALILGPVGEVTREQSELATKLVKSNRRSMRHRHEVRIDFCCGLVGAAEEASLA